MKKMDLMAATFSMAMLNVSGTALASGQIPDEVTDADFRNHSDAIVELGKNLMFDKILSGNRNTSCATCQHSLTDTGDGLSLPVGEGGKGLGITRDTGSYNIEEDRDDAIHERVPRNAPPVFNLGAHEFEVLFHDGRVFVDAVSNSGCKTPAGDDLPHNLENVLACQAMFPVTSPTEMLGQVGENDIADAAAAAEEEGRSPEVEVWSRLAERLQDPVNGYVKLFKKAFKDIHNASDITYAHAASAIAAFEGTNWRADNSPFDQYLHGDLDAMSSNAEKGMGFFYQGDSEGQACADCHGGKFQTDHSFHAIAMPQIGAGKGDGDDGHEDFGLEQVTEDESDRYKFRTPSLRNIALTAPYGHTGPYNTLRAVVEHHMDTVNAIKSYDQSQAVLPSRDDLDTLDFIVMNDQKRVKNIAKASELPPFTYTPIEIDRIVDFLNALTDPGSIDLRNDTPMTVPSGIPVAE